MNGIYIAASGAAAQAKKIDIIAQNLANSDTAGYRRFGLEIDAASGNDSPYEYAVTRNEAPSIDMRQGPLRATGNPLDVAIAGPAFIRVRSVDGGEAYTRDGALQVSADGTLLAADQPVLQADGRPLIVPSGTLSIGADGSVSANGQIVGTIGLADATGAVLEPAGSSLYRASNEVTLGQAPASTRLKVGFLEGPDGNPARDVVSLVDAMRSYESALKAVHTIDEVDDKAIQTFTLQS